LLIWQADADFARFSKRWHRGQFLVTPVGIPHPAEPFTPWKLGAPRGEVNFNLFTSALSFFIVSA
jgi:hypothetical protein